MNTPTPNPKTAIVATLRIPAGDQRRIDVEGDFYEVVSSNFEFELMRTGTGFLPVQQGDEEELPPGQVFSILNVRNPATNGAELVVSIYAGYGRRRQSRQSTMETPTQASGGNVVSLAAAGTIVLTGVPSGTNIRRKAVMVANFDLTNPLLIQDELGNTFSACMPGTAWRENVTGQVTIKNNTGNAISCCVGEIWYSTR